MDTSKIIKGVVNSGRYTVTAPIVKEDYGLYLQIEGVELPQTYEVDFSNSENSGTSVTMIGNSDGVLIPHQFIDTGKDIFAFLYHVGEDFGRTVYKFRIPNKVRPDRTDDTPTPEQASVIDQAISALNEAVEQTAQDKADADASAQNASADAERAEEARTDAQNYAIQAEQAMDDAQTYANNASTSATASAQSASQSAQIKADVEDLVDDAQGYAQASAQSASASANSASQAQGFAQSASASATNAQGYASNAQTSANTASSKATEASGYADTASAKATESAQSASQALGYKNDAESAKTASQTAQGLAESARDTAVSAKTDAESARDDAESARDEAQSAVASISGALAEKAPVITDTASGAIASFSDGADDLPLKSLIVDINPVQDLHGQENPYPAGGGKNLLDYGDYSSSYRVTSVTDDGNGTFTVVASEYGAYIDHIINVTPNQEYCIKAENASNVSGNASQMPVVLVYDGETDSASILLNNASIISKKTFTPTADKILVRNKVTGGSGAGTGIIVKPQLELGSTATSWSPYENLCPISGWTEVQTNISGINVWDEEWELGYLADGQPQPHIASIRSKNFVKCDANAKYYSKFKSTPTLYISVYDKNKNYITRFVGYNVEFTTPANAMWMKVSCYSYGTTYNHDISINYPSTDHSYHPYTGRSITINLGQTVYGGKLDVLSGVLTVDMAMVDLGTLAWSSGFQGFVSSSLVDQIKSIPRGGSTSAICDMYPVESVSGAPTTDFRLNIYADNGNSYKNYVIVKDSTCSTVADFKTAMDGVMLCYELAEPLTIQLTPNQINSLYGVNNLWADSGDTEVEYRADTKAYIAKKIAEALASLT